MPGTEAIEWTACAGFLLGAAASWRFVHAERIEWRLPRMALVVLAAALTGALPVVLFRSLTDLFLAATASLSNVALLFFVRGLAVVVVLSAAGALWAAFVGGGTVSEPAAGESASDRHPRFLAISGPALLAGLIGARWLIMVGVPLPFLVAVGESVAGDSCLRCGVSRGRRSRQVARRQPDGSLPPPCWQSAPWAMPMSRRVRRGSCSRPTSSWPGETRRRAACSRFSTTAACSPSAKGNAALTLYGSNEVCSFRSGKAAFPAGPSARGPKLAPNFPAKSSRPSCLWCCTKPRVTC